MTVPAPHYLLFSESRRPRAAEDGHFSSPQNKGQWHFVLETLDGRVRFEAADEEFESEEDRLSLLAVVRGLEALEQPSRVTVVTTSRYVSRGFLFGLEEWRENDWRWERFGEMTPIKNQDLWQRIDRAMRYHRVECRVWRFDVPETPAPASTAFSSPVASQQCAKSSEHRRPSRRRQPASRSSPHAVASWGQLVCAFWHRCRDRLRGGLLRLEAA